MVEGVPFDKWELDVMFELVTNGTVRFVQL